MRATASGDSGLAAEVPSEVAVLIDQWRRVHLPDHLQIAPHVTVAYPPFIPEEDWLLLRPEVAECLQAFQPFQVALTEPGVFAGEPHVLWLRPEDGGRFSRIREALAERMPDYFPPMPWEYVPHVTIGAFDTQEALAQARQVVGSEWSPVRFEVGELVYAVMLADGTYRIADRVALGRTEQVSAT
ncbi:MAG TPA: 2'-5' RNA ligase family protein [Anaerolineae bacterium]|nr:2'-5' RNA ligase family protein [Anaerolineae bacterium]